MFHSLWFRLVGTLAAATVVALGVVTVTANAVTARQFDIYSTRSSAIWAAQIAPVLAEQYRQDGDWHQAQDALVNPWRIPPRTRQPGSMPNMMGPQGRPANMWGMMNIHVLLIDRDGNVVADSQEVLQGQRVDPDVAQQGTPIVVDSQQVGSVIAIPADAADRAQLTRNFLSTVAGSVILAAMASGFVTLVLGTWLFRRITKPLDQLRQAARTVESGELAARVPITTRDEFGVVADAFNQMTARLEKQQRLRKQMVSDIAHDLRTPLSVMQGTIEAMQDGVLQPDKSELDNLHQEVGRLTRLVEDLRTLSLVDEGQLRLEIRPVDVATTVEQVARSLMTLAEGQKITLKARVKRPIAAVGADEDRLVEVLTNLLDNALRHTPEGGLVNIEASQVEQSVEIRIQDSGVGIPEEDIPFIFERFWRGDKSRSRESGGSGMGLAIARQLVELHGGTISAQSKVGEGTIFTVRLPLRS